MKAASFTSIKESFSEASARAGGLRRPLIRRGLARCWHRGVSRGVYAGEGRSAWTAVSAVKSPWACGQRVGGEKREEGVSRDVFVGSVEGGGGSGVSRGVCWGGGAGGGALKDI